MKLKFLACAFAISTAAALGLAACGNDDDPKQDPDRGTHTDVAAPEGFTFVAPDDNPAKGFVSTSADYTVEFYENRTADIHIRGIQLAEGSAPAAIDITSVPYTRQSDGSYKIDAENLTSVGGAVRFSDLEMVCGSTDNDALVDKEPNAAIFSFSAETNSGMCLTFIPYDIVASGTTVITGGDAPFTSRETSYAIYVDPATSLATVTVRNARFAPNMPSVGDMVFAGISVTFDDRGGYHLYSESLVPSIAGVPYPSFAIQRFNADVELDSDSDIDISFMCNAMGRSYTVTAENLSYYSLGAR